MIKRILTICAAVCAALAAGAAATSLAQAQQGYPAYSTAPEPYGPALEDSRNTLFYLFRCADAKNVAGRCG